MKLPSKITQEELDEIQSLYDTAIENLETSTGDELLVLAKKIPLNHKSRQS